MKHMHLTYNSLQNPVIKSAKRVLYLSMEKDGC